MLCNRCGKPNPDDLSLCRFCGHKLLTRSYAPEEKSEDDIPLLDSFSRPESSELRRSIGRKELEAWIYIVILLLASLAAWAGFGFIPLAVAVPVVALLAWVRRV